MMRILLDTNVVLDVLLDREPHADASAAVWAAVETGRTEGMLAAHAVTTIDYLLRKSLGSRKARQLLSAILSVFRIAGVDGPVLQEALQMAVPDFEDAVTASAARWAGCGAVVTRDPKGFRGAAVPAMTPEAARAMFS